MRQHRQYDHYATNDSAWFRDMRAIHTGTDDVGIWAWMYIIRTTPREQRPDFARNVLSPAVWVTINER